MSVTQAKTIISDPVGSATPGAQEIGFSVPERYNASDILFRNLAAGRGTRVAVYCGDLELSYAELCERACRYGNALKGLGLSAGERVLLLLHDTPEFQAAFFGAVRAGFVPMLINTLSPTDQLKYFLDDGDVKVAVVEADLQAKLSEAAAGTGLESLIIVNAEAAKREAAANLKTYAAGDLLTQQVAELPPADTHRDDMAFWMYSSGSTGQPKGVVHLQHDMAYTAASYADKVLDIRETDRCFSIPKLFFAYGFGNGLTFPFAVGGASILHPGQPRPEAAFDVIERRRPTLFFGVPTLYAAMLEADPDGARDLSSLRFCLSAAEALPPEIYEAWLERYGVQIIEGLGSTELLHVYVSNRPGAAKVGSSGRRVPGYEIKLLDMDDQEVPRGETGNMWVRGDSSAPQYWNRPDKTAHTMRADWLFTGDRFYQDDDDNYFFNGRADEMLKVSGQWVYPLEIELCLLTHEAVQECAVLGVKDEQGLTKTKAYIKLRSGYEASPDFAKTLQSYVKKALLPYKYPRVVEFMNELPKTGTSKIDRVKLRGL